MVEHKRRATTKHWATIKHYENPVLKLNSVLK